jgi:hypothetical protein
MWFIMYLSKQTTKGSIMSKTINRDNKELFSAYYSALSHASNTVNIFSGTSIDHLTITGFMSTDAEMMKHLESIEGFAIDRDSNFKPLYCHVLEQLNDLDAA